jgi:polyketide cyclase/dehydrase/lipid transport protein
LCFGFLCGLETKALPPKSNLSPPLRPGQTHALWRSLNYNRSAELNPPAQFTTTLPWEITHSVETDASPAFAWNYWTNVANWDDPPARFELDGPFASGSRGTTRLPGQEPLQWFIREVTPPHAATIEMHLERATLSFEWRLDRLAEGRTRLTQRVVLQGENADVYLAHAKSTFTASLPDGMNQLATAIANAHASRGGSG